jgi:regulatory protein
VKPYAQKSRKPRKPPATDPESLYAAAIRSLASRARSSGEVRTLLTRRKAAQADIEAVIERLRDHGYLDDVRFARSFVASRVENDLHGRVRVRRDLAARRVRPEIAEEAVRAGFDRLDEAKLLREHLRRKIRLSRHLDKPSKVQALHRRLLRAGFRSDTIVGELKRLLPRVPSKAEGRVSSKPALGDGSDEEPLRWDELLDSLVETEEQ